MSNDFETIMSNDFFFLGEFLEGAQVEPPVSEILSSLTRPKGQVRLHLLQGEQESLLEFLGDCLKMPSPEAITSDKTFADNWAYIAGLARTIRDRAVLISKFKPEELEAMKSWDDVTAAYRALDAEGRSLLRSWPQGGQDGV